MKPIVTNAMPLSTCAFMPVDEVQTLVDRVKREFQPVRHAELVEDVVQMVLHRLLADEHLLGHLPVLVALRDQADDLALALAERRPLAALCWAAPLITSAGEANWRITAAVVWESSQISPACTLRMLLTISSGAVCFRTMPEQPSFIA